VATAEGTFLEHKCREDDIILHTTGEMTNPLVTEDVINANCPFVRRACVIGAMQPVPSLVVEMVAADGNTPPPEDVAQLLWQAVKEANAKQPSYSAIKKSKIQVLLPGNELPGNPPCAIPPPALPA
jgi:long-subunit acyl-CoA synthetase (AMP-forming)